MSADRRGIAFVGEAATSQVTDPSSYPGKFMIDIPVR
jgi:hypothetical protein